MIRTLKVAYSGVMDVERQDHWRGLRKLVGDLESKANLHWAIMRLKRTLRALAQLAAQKWLFSYRCEVEHHLTEQKRRLHGSRRVYKALRT